MDLLDFPDAVEVYLGLWEGENVVLGLGVGGLVDDVHLDGFL